jgi:5-methylcytosine-specific restriction endonuclease McrA
MTEKDRERHRKFRRLLPVRRQALIDKLGGKCTICGSIKKLEFDHYPKRCDFDHNKLSQWTRLKRYEQDAEAGNLRILCSKCNQSHGGAVRAWEAGHITSEGEGTPIL